MTEQTSGPSVGIEETTPWHAQEAAIALAAFGAAEAGLGAGEVARRLAEHGPNRLPEPKGRGPLRRFLARRPSCSPSACRCTPRGRAAKRRRC